MRVKIQKFGDILVSRPTGREAYMVATAYILPKDRNESIILDFERVKVLAPSWADEFITKIMESYQHVSFEHTENPSVKATLDILGNHSIKVD